MAAVDYFLKIEGVEGESTDDKHKGSIDVMSWSWGESNAGTHGSGGGGGAGKVVVQDFHFVMKMSKASAKLFVACATGEHFKKAVMTCRKGGGGSKESQVEYLKIEMTDLNVTSYQTGGSGQSDIVPTDQISLNFAKIVFEYKAQKADGSLESPKMAGYDIKANKAV